MSDAALPQPTSAMDAPEAARPSAKNRIKLLDAARGLGVLGILPCNMPDFAYPAAVSGAMRSWPHGTGWETLTALALTQIVFQRKFVSLFSMMFGVSVFLVGGERSDAERGMILRKRLLVLLAIGLFHCFAIWYGDVLISYALGGFIVLLVRSWSPGRLLALGLGVWLLICAIFALGAVFQAGMPPPKDAAAELAKSVANNLKAIAHYQGGFLQSLRANAEDGFQSQVAQVGIVPATFGLMCIGLACYKWGIFTGEASRGVYLALLGAGLAALAVVGIDYAILLRSGLSRTAGAPAAFTQTALAPLTSLAYVSLLFFALRSKVWKWLPNVLAPVGQMAFTNYLTQSLMMTALFYAGRGPDLYARVDRPGLWAIVLAVWLLQIIWSRLWLTYFTMGPLEWGWRRLYRGDSPLRRARPGPPVLTATPAV